MPVHTAKRGKSYVVVDDKGKVHGRHGSKKKAVAQVTSMNISMGHVPGVKPRKKKGKR